jgi:hypothetical protein
MIFALSVIPQDSKLSLASLERLLNALLNESTRRSPYSVHFAVPNLDVEKQIHNTIGKGQCAGT